MTEDKLEEIFKKQRDLQEHLGQDLHKQEYININVLALTDEIHEAIRETSWKPWKKQQVTNIDNYKKELVDALHFFVNLCLAADMTAQELRDMYCEKREVNIQRKDTGY
jgi:dimeric dUTPase (all-alpha-NTP-PPase superfamily)